MTEERDANQLARRVDELIRRQLEDSQRAVEEVPVLTEVLERELRAGGGDPARMPMLAADLERALLARLLPELNRQVAGMRGELEKELRRAVREAVSAALASPVREQDAG